MVAASVCVAGVALGDIGLRFATSIFTLRGRHGTYGTGLGLGRAWFPFGAWSPTPFGWQAWHLVTLTFALRGRRGTYGTGLALVTRLVPVWRRGRRLRSRGTW